MTPIQDSPAVLDVAEPPGESDVDTPSHGFDPAVWTAEPSNLSAVSSMLHPGDLGSYFLPTVTVRCTYSQGSLAPVVLYPSPQDAGVASYGLGFTLEILAVWGLESALIRPAPTLLGLEP